MPGKTEAARAALETSLGASMRPQRNAGENWQVRDDEYHHAFGASMRPQRNAGENLRSVASGPPSGLALQ